MKTSTIIAWVVVVLIYTAVMTIVITEEYDITIFDNGKTRN